MKNKDWFKIHTEPVLYTQDFSTFQEEIPEELQNLEREGESEEEMEM